MRPRSFRVAPPNDDELLAVESFGFAPQTAVSRRIGPVRLSPLACPGARHRRANPFSRDRERLLRGNPSGDTVQAMQPLLRARVRREPVRRASGLSSRRPRVGVGPRPPGVLNLRAACNCRWLRNVHRRGFTINYLIRDHARRSRVPGGGFNGFCLFDRDRVQSGRGQLQRVSVPGLVHTRALFRRERRSFLRDGAPILRARYSNRVPASEFGSRSGKRPLSTLAIISVDSRPRRCENSSYGMIP
jgi:hypothetical protein